MRLPLLVISLCAALAGCAPAPESAPEPATAPVPTAPPAGHASGPEISAEDFAEHVRILASDEFEGRAPGSAGEQRTVDYLIEQFQRLGLEPGNAGSWVQEVPMLSSRADPATQLRIDFADGSDTLAFGDDMVIGTSTGQARVDIDDSELVFVGYGVNAPEAGWNDYPLDVKGKTVVVLVNDPGFHAGDAALFQGLRMTYYGRWTYKFEEAARQGAAAALIVHDDAGAGYGWDVVRNSWGGIQFDLPPSEDPAPRLAAQGWISADAATRLFQRAGLDFAALRMAANRPGFHPVALNAKATLKLDSEITTSSSRNVVAQLRGSQRPDEAVVYMAHWDHLGRNPDLHDDSIFNGAIDNATGVAGILEIAEAFVTQPEPPERSLLFLAVTLEESGLLGSKYYAAHPGFALQDMVGIINLDAMHLPGPTRDMVVIGMGNSEMEDRLRVLAERQGRSLHAESGLEKGFYYRSDHFSFAKYGVPALYAKSGSDHVDNGAAFGAAWGEDYNTHRYHTPKDEFDPNWDLRGAISDLNLLYRVGSELADSEDWPNWYPGNEFRAARDAAMQARTAASKP